MFDAYRNRVKNKGNNIIEFYDNITKRQQARYIMESPSLKYVYINLDYNNLVPCIVSDEDTFRKRRFLFMPDLIVHAGDYVSYQDYTYLATNQTTDDKFPQLVGEVCNVEFPISTKQEKIRVGTDAMGRPIYETVVTNITKLGVMTDKIYSQANNNPIPLADGSIIVKIPYSTVANQFPKINENVLLYGGQYSVTTISQEFVVNDYGYIEVQLQRKPVTT